MRQIGTLSTESEAQTLVDYLLTEGISAQFDRDQDVWVVWVREENQVELAQRILEEYRQQPSDPKYVGARRRAEQLRSEAVRQRTAAARRTIDMRRRWSQPLSRRAPLVLVLIGLSIFASLATRFGNDSRSGLLHTLMFADMRPTIPPQPSDPLDAIRHGQFWRMITPIFLHGDILHLLFNMWWMYFLAPQIEMRRGTVRFGLLVLVLALASNWTQYLVYGNPNFMGMSGVVYGIFGYIWIKLKVDPREAYVLGDGTVILMMAVLALGFTGVLAGIANGAHMGGLLAGMAIAYGSSALGQAAP
jgi:GlpG protein